MQDENLQHVIYVLDVPELPEGAKVLDLCVIVPNLESGKINTCISNLVIVNISDSSRLPPCSLGFTMIHKSESPEHSCESLTIIWAAKPYQWHYVDCEACSFHCKNPTLSHWSNCTESSYATEVFERDFLYLQKTMWLNPLSQMMREMSHWKLCRWHLFHPSFL